MKRWLTAALTWAALLGGSIRLQADQGPSGESLPVRHRWVDFDVVQGRLRAHNPRHATTQFASRETEKPLLRESFSVNVDAGEPAVHYEQIEQGRRLCVEFQRRGAVTFEQEWDSSNGPHRACFQQPYVGPVTLLIEANNATNTYSAPSLWHLLLAEPKVSSQFLCPMLESVRPGWRLLDQARELECELLDVAEAGLLDHRTQWRTWVDQLASPHFAERQQADRALRASGYAVLAYLASLDVGRLDSEQRARINAIQRSMATRAGDTPDRLAAWLVADKPIWVTMLAHHNPTFRQAAAQHLSRICNESIEFTPDADETLRRRQLDRVRSQLAIDLPVR